MGRVSRGMQSPPRSQTEISSAKLHARFQYHVTKPAEPRELVAAMANLYGRERAGELARYIRQSTH